jgi:hypothetical protein
VGVKGHDAIRGRAELEFETGERRFDITDECAEIEVYRRGYRCGECGRICHGRIGVVDACGEGGAGEAIRIGGGGLEVMRAAGE